MTETTTTSETSLIFNQTKRSDNPEDKHLKEWKSTSIFYLIKKVLNISFLYSSVFHLPSFFLHVQIYYMYVEGEPSVGQMGRDIRGIKFNVGYMDTNCLCDYLLMFSS